MPLRKIAEISVPSCQKHLADVDQFTVNHLKKLGFSSADLDDIAIAVSEAVNNAIIHGNSSDEHKFVHVRLYYSSKILRIIVQDEGTGFSPDMVPNPRKPENLLKISGRGLLIISHLMDCVSFERRKKGMQIIMDKHRAGRD